MRLLVICWPIKETSRFGDPPLEALQKVLHPWGGKGTWVLVASVSGTLNPSALSKDAPAPVPPAITPLAPLGSR